MSLIYLINIVLICIICLLSPNIGCALTMVGVIILVQYLVLNVLLKRINPIFACVRYSKELSQMISFRFFFKNLFRNNFDSKIGNIKTSYMKEVINLSKNVESFFKETKIKRVKIITHESIYRQLYKFQRKNILTIDDVVKNKNVKKIKFKANKFMDKLISFIVKIDFIGVYTCLYNYNNQDFKNYMNTPLILKEYLITIHK